MKSILFISGTRADYGKIKSWMNVIKNDKNHKLQIFVTGMHLQDKYGHTVNEFYKDGFEEIYEYDNIMQDSDMDVLLANTITGINKYITENKTDLIVVHGDRLEALAGAIVGAFNNIMVAHIEGGEISGTIDESIRHAITKLSHIHFVANSEAKNRIIQLGEDKDNIYITGSPDIDIMLKIDNIRLETVLNRYEIDFTEFGIFIYHPVTTEVETLKEKINHVIDGLLSSNKNFVVIYPNNDSGSDIILDRLKKIASRRIKMIPSMRFEYFLKLLKECKLIVGNSSTGVREAGVFGKFCINLGSRQNGRYDKNDAGILSIEENDFRLKESIILNWNKKTKKTSVFGNGDSDIIFSEIISKEKFWNTQIQKRFIDFK